MAFYLLLYSIWNNLDTQKFRCENLGRNLYIIQFNKRFIQWRYKVRDIFDELNYLEKTLLINILQGMKKLLTTEA